MLALRAIDDVCTHEDLARITGGIVKLEELIPVEYGASSEVQREEAYDEVIRYLARREPPVREYDLSVIAELTRVVAYGAAYRLYLYAMTSGGNGDVFAEQFKTYKRLFDDELQGLRPTISGEYTQNVFTIPIGRR